MIGNFQQHFTTTAKKDMLVGMELLDMTEIMRRFIQMEVFV